MKNPNPTGYTEVEWTYFRLDASSTKVWAPDRDGTNYTEIEWTY